MPFTLKSTYLSPVAIFSASSSGQTAGTAGSTAALATGTNAISAVVDFRQTNSAIGGYTRGYFVIAAPAFSTAPTANTAIYLYWLKSTDGGATTFETDPGRSTTPPALPRAAFAFDGGTTVSTSAWARASEIVDVPAVPAEVIVANSAGQSLPAAWSLSFIPVTTQGV